MIKYGILMACNRLILLNPTEFCDYREKLYLKMQDRDPSDNYSGYEDLLETIQNISLPDPAPWLCAMQMVVPRHYAYPTLHSCKLQLNDVIRGHYQSLFRKIKWVKSIAPSTGLLFTVLGLMAVFFKQSQGLDHKQMLGDIGIALFTTAFSSLVLIFQITILNRLQDLVEQEFRTGMKLINGLFDIKKIHSQKTRYAHVFKSKQ
jgi:hypothetical protein